MTNKITYNILLADDDLEDQEILQEAIQESKPFASLRCVCNGLQMVDYLEQTADSMLPHLLILDYKMPFLNGVEVLQILLENPRYTHIPKVVWSTSSQPEHIKLCMKAGAIRYFTKPNSGQELNKLVSEIFEICDKQEYTSHKVNGEDIL
ncbi:Response regulator receiver domain-containing protein [Chitinophaga sp. CF118]|uniref:response regulator n=1 Tax=Chitinophaga sp. CF118 TaxID=1884367 RepID=UPI0008E8F3E0|nr:response regulator [Chitinophaga sp. CF118]SFF09972.1 Response regulator receiver domain-containing protein [Chitinophaga sp. CF118]